MDPTLYPGDPMLDTAKGYVSFFPKLMTILIKTCKNTELLYFVLHILSYFFYFTILYYISKLLFDETSTVLCLILVSTKKIVLDGSSIHFTGLYPAFFTLSFVLMAIYLFLKGRYAIAYAISRYQLKFPCPSCGPCGLHVFVLLALVCCFKKDLFRTVSKICRCICALRLSNHHLDIVDPW